MIRAENLSFGYTDKDLYHTISFTLAARMTTSSTAPWKPMGWVVLAL